MILLNTYRYVYKYEYINLLYAGVTWDGAPNLNLQNGWLWTYFYKKVKKCTNNELCATSRYIVFYVNHPDNEVNKNYDGMTL